MSKPKKSRDDEIATIKIKAKTQRRLNILASMRKMTVTDLIEELISDRLKEQLKYHYEINVKELDEED